MSVQGNAEGKLGRLLSLDIFRGATVAAMILVNNPGSFEDSWTQLRHAPWHGWTVTDLIFPFFLFIMGVAIEFSLARRREERRGFPWPHIFLRAATLFGLGLLVNAFPDFRLSDLRIPGVLQRIGICFGLAAVLVGMTTARVRFMFGVGLLALYWVAMRTIPVPGVGAGVLEPGGNLCWYIDSNLLAGHTWIFAPAPGFDPEGILSTIPALVSTLAGTIVGARLRSGKTSRREVRPFAWWGAGLVVLGLVLGHWFPINKNLWSPSFVVLTTGWALIAFFLLHVSIERWGSGRWAVPFVALGKNALAVFVFSELLASALWSIPAGGATLHDRIFETFFLPLAPAGMASFLFSSVFVLLMLAGSWLLLKRRVFIKI